MAEQNDFEKTEAASPRRLEQAREQGRVPRSQELTTFAMLFAGGAGLWFTGGHTFEQLRTLFASALRLDAASVFSPAHMTLRLHEEAWSAAQAVLPLLILLLIVAIAAPQMLSGWLFTWNAVRVDLNRINPMAGIARLFSLHALAELVKALIKAALVAAVAAAVIWHYHEPVLALVGMPLETGIASMTHMFGVSFLIIGGTLALVAVIDVPFQLWRYADGLKMSREEVRQETKESEGDPQIKAAIRSQQRALARGRMMQEVPKASVIVVNPTHYSVALRYDDKTMRAPRVVAKGAGVIAAAIRELGEQHRIPVLEAPPLARALYRHTDIGAEIPEQLYTAVAEVLAYVFQLKRYQQHGGRTPQPLRSIDVPSGLDPAAGGAR